MLLQALQPFGLPSSPRGDALRGDLQIHGERHPVTLSQVQVRGPTPPNARDRPLSERELEPEEGGRPLLISHAKISSVAAQGNKNTARNPRLYSLGKEKLILKLLQVVPA